MGEGQEKADNKRRLIANGAWTCTRCHTLNPGYTGTCRCGRSKSDNEQFIRMAAELEQKAETQQEEKSAQAEINNTKPDEGGWNCKRCGCLNARYRRTCDSCGAISPEVIQKL